MWYSQFSHSLKAGQQLLPADSLASSALTDIASSDSSVTEHTMNKKNALSSSADLRRQWCADCSYIRGHFLNSPSFSTAIAPQQTRDTVSQRLNFHHLNLQTHRQDQSGSNVNWCCVFFYTSKKVTHIVLVHSQIVWSKAVFQKLWGPGAHRLVWRWSIFPRGVSGYVLYTAYLHARHSLWWPDPCSKTSPVFHRQPLKWHIKTIKCCMQT